MASSGSFTGSGVGTSPYLILDWAILQQDIANNRSQVRLTLKCYSQYYVNFSATKSGVLEGTSFSYSGGMTGSNITKTLYTKDIWITHNSDGGKSITFDATFNIAITWSGNYLPSLSVSGTAELDDIPRASLLNSFSMGSNLKVSTANSINLSITRYDGSFTHDITLKLGSYVVAAWTGQGVPTSLTLTSTQVNEMLSRITGGATATVTLVVQTKLGSTNIGSSVSRTATATVDSTVMPTATGLAVSIYGSGHDSSIGKFIEDISKAVASFNAAAGYGASITSTSIVVRRDSDDADPHNISGTSGTTGVLSLSGTYEAYATVTDSRNRTATQKITFAVYAYSAPKITAFTAQRNSADETIANISASGTFTIPAAGDNSLDILIETRIAGGSWNTLVDTNVAASPFSQTPDSTGHAITSSYEFRITIADEFGKSATSVVSISTSKVVLAVLKDEAVGIGKIPEAGGAALQVGGDSLIDGILNALGGLQCVVSGFDGNTPVTSFPQGISMQYTGGTNLPSSVGILITVYNSTFRNFQLFHIKDNTRLFLRYWHSVNNAWSAWVELSMDGHTHSNYLEDGDTVGSLYANSAFRMNGTAPFYFQTYGGGWYMSDTSWIRNYNNKNLYMTTAVMRSDGEIQQGGSGAGFRANSNGISSKNRALGHLDISPTANSPTSASVSFGTTFVSTRPTINVTAYTSVPYSDVKEVSFNNPSATGCSIVIYRDNTTATGCYWFAADDN